MVMVESGGAVILPVFPPASGDPALSPFRGPPFSNQKRTGLGLPIGGLVDFAGKFGSEIGDVEPGIGSFGTAFLVPEGLPELLEGLQLPAGEFSSAFSEIIFGGTCRQGIRREGFALMWIGNGSIVRGGSREMACRLFCNCSCRNGYGISFRR